MGSLLNKFNRNKCKSEVILKYFLKVKKIFKIVSIYSYKCLYYSIIILLEFCIFDFFPVGDFSL